MSFWRALRGFYHNRPLWWAARKQQSPIAPLFRGGESGARLNINELTLLYTTSAGTTNVSAVNDPIGRAERKAGTTHALNSTTTQRPLLRQWPNGGRYHAYHDRVDDKLTLLSMPAGTYTVGFASFAGVYVYPIVLNATGTLSLPGADYTELFIVNRVLTPAETAAVTGYLETKTPLIGSDDIFRLYSATNSVNLSITETGGSSGATWELGDGQTASGTSCVKTIAAPQSIIFRATDPSKIQVIDWGSKSLFGQIKDLSRLTALSTFNCRYNQLTGSIPSLSNNTALSVFYCDGNQLTGSIPSLSNNTALSVFYCRSNQLTGSIPSLSANTALTYFYCENNQLTGSIPSLSNNTALHTFYCDNNQLTGSIPSLSNNIGLAVFVCSSNQLTGSIPSLSNNTTLGAFSCNSNQLTGSIPLLPITISSFYCNGNQLTGSIPSLSNNTGLTYFLCYNNQLTDFSGGTVSTTLGNFQAQNNLLTASAVNAILAAFVAANKTTGTRILNLGGTGNAAPTGQGIIDKATLVSRGWTVTTN